MVDLIATMEIWFENVHREKAAKGNPAI
jgi:hypothetical protein